MYSHYCEWVVFRGLDSHIKGGSVYKGAIFGT